MAILSIFRDWGTHPSIVRITSTDTLAACTASGYITAQAANIELANSGAFEWVLGDFVALNAADGSNFFLINAAFTSLVYLPGLSPANLDQTAVVSLSSANIEAMYATPVSILAAPGAGLINIIDTIHWDYAYLTAQYTAGGLITAQYGSTAHAGGIVSTLGIAAATFNGLAANGQLLDVATSFGGANTVVENAAIYMSNATQAFASGSGTVTLYIRYRTVAPA